MSQVKFYTGSNIASATGEAGAVYFTEGANYPRLYIGEDKKPVGEHVDKLLIGNSTSTPNYSIVGGTNDKTVISNILGSLASASVSVDVPKSEAPCTISYGSGNIVNSTGGNAIGVWNTSGVKGYYWTNITFNSNGTATITLSTKQSSTSAVTPSDWAIGDTISIVNNSKYPACAKITAVGSGTITVDSLPFTEVDSPSLKTPDDNSIFACYQKEEVKYSILGQVLAENYRWYPRSGEVELGWAGTAFGVENLVTGSGSFSSGWNNWSAGDFGATIGRDNISGYAGLTVGSGNTSNSDSALVTGHGNEVTGSTNAIVGGGSNVVSAGQAIVGGYNNSVTDGSAGAIVTGDSNILTGGYCTFVNGRNNTVSGGQSIIGGQYVTNTGGRNLVVGDRVADTVAQGATQTYTITEVTGNNNIVGGLGNTVSSNHSAAFGTRNSLTGNKGQIAAGSNNVLTNWNNAAFGRHLNVTTSAMAAVGQFNKPTEDRAMFVVGNGNANSSGAGNNTGKADEVCDNGTTYSIVRDNAFVVYYNGSYAGGWGHSLKDGKCNIIGGRQHTFINDKGEGVSQSFAAGQQNTIKSGNSGAIGYANVINQSCSGSFAIGMSNTVAATNQFVAGKYCKPTTGAFIVVGNGSKGAEISEEELASYTGDKIKEGSKWYALNGRNVFVVNSDGRITGGADPTGDMDLVTKHYFENNATKVEWENITSDVNISDTHNLTVGGNVTINGDLSFNGDLEFGNLSVTDMTASNTLNVGSNTISSQFAGAIGRKNTLSANQTLAVGYSNTNQASCTLTAGEGLTASKWCQTVLGKYNATDDSALIIAGWGDSSSSKKNVFKVLTSGKVIGGVSTTASDNDLTLATKDYVDSHSGGLTAEDIDTTYLTIDETTGKLTVKVEAILNELLNKEW